MHAGLLILLWLIGIAVLQFVTAWGLSAAVLCTGAVAVCYARTRCFRLLKRIRFLLAAIFILFAFFTPGQALLTDFPDISPSIEGLELALTHGGRILAVIFCVAILMQKLPPQRLVGGIYALLRPFSMLGISTERIAVRVLLTLRIADSDVTGHWREWITATDTELPSPVIIERERLSMADWLILTTAVLLAIAVAVGPAS